MDSPADKLRRSIASWRAARAASLRARWAGEPGEAEEVAQARASLGRGRGRALLEEALSLGLLSPADERAFLSHLADAAYDEVFWRARGPEPVAWSDVVEADGERRTVAEVCVAASRERRPPGLSASMTHVIERHRRWSDVATEAEQARRTVLARARTPEPESAIDVEAWLGATDDALAEATERAVHALGPWDGATAGARSDRSSLLVRLARAEQVDPLVPSRGRLDRLARDLGALGFDDRIARRLRSETRSEATFRAAVLLVEEPVPRVVLGLCPLELGLLGEIEALDGLGRALAHALVSPALNLEHRLQAGSEVPPTLGAVLALLAADRVYLRRALGPDGRAVEALRAHALWILLVRARLALARSRARAMRLDVGGEEAHALSSRALGLGATREVGALLASFEPDVELGAAALGAALAPALFVALRERFDEDFFRNPRIGRVVGGAAARGPLLRSADWIAELGGASDGAAAVRALAAEWLR